MVVNNFDKILSELGWTDGFRIPLVNDENEKLQRELEEKIREKNDLVVKLEYLQERLNDVKKCKESLNVKHAENQKFIIIQRTQVEAEENLYQFNRNTDSKLRQEASQYNKECAAIEERLRNAKKERDRVNKKIETSIKEIKLDRATLKNWDAILNRSEVDNGIIQQMMEDDTKTYKQLELKRQKLTVECDNYRQAARKAFVEMHEMENVHDRTIKMYAQALQETQEITKQYQQSTDVLHHRDEAIQAIRVENDNLRKSIDIKMEDVKEEQNYLQDQYKNNKELEDLIRQLEKKLSNSKMEHQKTDENVNMYAIEVDIQQKELKNLSQRTDELRTLVKHKKAELDTKKKKIERYTNRIKKISDTMEQLGNRKMTVAEKAKQLEDIIYEQKKNRESLNRHLKRIQVLSMNVNNRINEQKNEKKILDAQLASEARESQSLKIAYERELENLVSKKEALNRVDFELRKYESRLERLKGNTSDASEQKNRQKKIESLQIIYNEKLTEMKILQNELTVIERQTRKTMNSITNDNKELERMKNRQQDFILLIEGTKEHLKLMEKNKEEKLVEESILRLRVMQVLDITNKVENKVYNLERYRLKLNAALQERKAEIIAQKEELIIQRRMLADECSQLKIAISERKTRVKQLMHRYDNIVVTYGKNPDGSQISTAQLKIQNAQERYMLQEQGDNLDLTIRNTEQEIQSMENTLRVVNACNEKFKVHVCGDELDEAAREELRMVEDELNIAIKEMKSNEAHLIRVNQEYEKINEKLKLIDEEIKIAMDTVEEKKSVLAVVQQQIVEQKKKMLRSRKKGVDKALKPLDKKRIALSEFQLTQDDLLKFVKRNPDAYPFIKKILSEHNLEIPLEIESYEFESCSRNESSANSVDNLSKPASRSKVIPSRDGINSINLEFPYDIDTDCSCKKSTRSSKVTYV